MPCFNIWKKTGKDVSCYFKYYSIFLIIIFCKIKGGNMGIKRYAIFAAVAASILILLFTGCGSPKEGISTKADSMITAAEYVTTEAKGVTTETKSPDTNPYYVDEQIKIATEANSFQNLSIDNRKEIINKLLTQLKCDGAINYFSYNECGCVFSFEYSNGTPGGIQIKEFDPNLN